MEIREVNEYELKDCLDLVWEVFSEYEANEYSEEGINEFWTFIHNQNDIDKLCIYGSFEGDEITGVIAMRKEHISLFFVKEENQNQGIGNALFKYVLTMIKGDEISVNSSPYAVEIYKKLGFIAVENEKITNGIRYTPMIYKRI